METDADRNHDQHNASRNLNIELLRVIAVFSIVFYHYNNIHSEIVTRSWLNGGGITIGQKKHANEILPTGDYALQLNEILNSRSYRLACKLRRIKNKVLLK